ncbi:MAG: UvrB/UvrC motif-containing protein, partial [Nitrospinaceae bacterium]
VTPASIVKGIGEALSRAEPELPLVAEEEEDYGGNLLELVASLEKQMYAAARELEFEKAAALRDRIKKLRDLDLRASA